MTFIQSKPNLFPAPKKPIASYRNQHSPNPAHHNYNRAQNYNQKLTSRLSWLTLQCAGAEGNLGSAVSQLARLFGGDFNKLPEADKLELIKLSNEVYKVRASLRIVTAMVKETNRTKTRLTKEQMGIPNKK